jgi:hypothetical protein
MFQRCPYGVDKLAVAVAPELVGELMTYLGARA